MKQFNNDAFFLCTLPDLFNLETFWQRDIKSDTQNNFLYQFSITTNQSYTIAGRSINLFC